MVVACDAAADVSCVSLADVPDRVEPGSLEIGVWGSTLRTCLAIVCICETLRAVRGQISATDLRHPIVSRI